MSRETQDDTIDTIDCPGTPSPHTIHLATTPQLATRPVRNASEEVGEGVKRAGGVGGGV
jgi:hypothetical protein